MLSFDFQFDSIAFFCYLQSMNQIRQKKNSNAIDIKNYNPTISKLSFNYGWGANIIVVSSEKGLLLIDSGYRKKISELYDLLKNKYNKPIHKIINTHFHGDHIGGNDLASENGELIAHKNVEKRKFYVDHFSLINEPTSVNFGSEHLTITPIPYGHSDTDMLVFLKETNIIHTGDLYLSESFPLVSFGEKNSAYTLIENLYALYQYIDSQTIIVSGHGKDTNKSDLKNYLEMLEETVHIVERKIKQGSNKSEIKRQDVLKAYDCWSGTIEFITKNSWIENIWRSFHNREKQL